MIDSMKTQNELTFLFPSALAIVRNIFNLENCVITINNCYIFIQIY